MEPVMSVAMRSMGTAAQQWARGVLTAESDITDLLPDGTNGVHGGHPMQGVSRPYGVVMIPSVQSPLRPSMGLNRYWTVVRMLVKWIGSPSQHDTLLTLANTADTLFEGAKLQAVGDDVMMVACYRDGEFHPDPDELGGDLTEQLGMFYAVTLRELGQT